MNSLSTFQGKDIMCVRACVCLFSFIQALVTSSVLDIKKARKHSLFESPEKVICGPSKEALSDIYAATVSFPLDLQAIMQTKTF